MKNLKSQFKIKNYLLIFTLILTPFLFFNTVNAAYVDITANSLGQTSFNLTVNEKIATPLTNETAGPSATSQSIPNPSTATYTFSVPNPLSSKTIFDLIQRVINGLIILSVPIASILIIYSGILYMTSAGTDRIKKATSALVWTIAGFGLLLISSGIIDAVKNILGVTTDKGTGATPPIVLGGPKTFQDILNIFIDLANKFFTFAIIIASVMIIVSGISFMTARDDATKAATSRKMLIYAIIGVVVAITSTFIIQVVKNYFLS